VGDEPGRAVQLDPIKPTLKAPGTKRLKLKSDEPLLKFAFSFNLRRYSQVHSRTFRVEEPSAPAAGAGAGAGPTAGPAAGVGGGCAVRRVMVPFVDLLNHDSDADQVSCEWGCEWRGLPDGARHVTQSIHPPLLN